MRFPKVSTTNINGLPLGYTEVEYLQSSGTQYINTGISGNNPNLKIEVNATTYEFGWCHQNNASGSWVDAFSFPSDNKERVNYGSYSLVKDFDYDRITRKIRTFDFQTGFYIDGVLSQSFTISNYSSLTPSLPLFARYDFNSSSYTILANSSYTIYSAKIWDNNTLVRDFIPCLDSNNRPCMYDRVEGKPYYNVGTDEFSYGRKIYGVEYLESSTTNARISTGILLDTFPFTAKVSVSSKSEYNPFYQVIVGTTNSTNQYLIGLKSGDPDFTMKYNNVAKTVGVVPVADKKYEISTTLTSTTMTMNINGTDYSYTQTLIANNEEIGLFPQNYNASSMRIYGVQLIKNNTIVRDYVPVKDENNIGYMLDRVNHTLYENKGTGAFVVGGDTLGKSKAKLIKTKTTVSGLPYGFTEVEYLESNAGQYIDTGIQPTDTHGYRIRNTYTAGGGEQCAIGCMDSNNRFVGVYTSGNTNSLSGAWGSYVGFLPNYPWTTGTILDVKGNYKNNRKLIIDSTEMKDISDTHISGTIENTVYLFARHYGSTVTKMHGRIYSAEITNGQDIIHKFIPALDSSNKPCMYDIVEGKAYYNQGTGEFTYGPKIIPVDYLESTGTQYIDTGIKGKNNLDFDYKCIFTKLNGTAQCVGGHWSGESTSTISFYLGLIRANGNFAYHYDGTRSPVIVMDTTVQDIPYSVQGHMWVGEQYMVINGIKSSVETISSIFTSPINIYLFGLNNNELANPAYMKLYYCKIYDNGSLVRDYIPVKDENGVGYMFDKIGHTLYENKGTGSFVVGDEKKLYKTNMVKTALVPAGYTRVKYLESSGVQYIDTGILPGSYSKAKIGFEWKDGNVGYDKYIIGSVSSVSMRYYFGTYQSKWQYGYCGATKQAEGIEENKYYDAYVTWDPSNQIVVLNGKTIITNNTATDTTSDNTFALFGRHQGNAFNQTWLSKSKIYYCKIYTGTTIVRDYIPVIRNSDNKPGMWDRVSKTFFTNGGSGDDFTYESL